MKRAGVALVGFTLLLAGTGMARAQSAGAPSVHHAPISSAPRPSARHEEITTGAARRRRRRACACDMTDPARSGSEAPALAALAAMVLLWRRHQREPVSGRAAP